MTNIAVKEVNNQYWRKAKNMGRRAVRLDRATEQALIAQAIRDGKLTVCEPGVAENALHWSRPDHSAGIDAG